MALTLEEPFGALLRHLRERSGCNLQDLPQFVFDETGEGISWRGVQKIENGETKRPRPETMKTLCRFFYRGRYLESEEDVAYFCVRAGYRVQKLQVTDGHDIATLILSPLQGTGFRDLVYLVLESASSADERTRGVVEAFGDGLKNLMRSLGSLVPGPTEAVAKLEERVERFLAADRLDDGEASALVSELEGRFEAERSRVSSFRLAFLLSRVEERRGNYRAAVDAADRAYHLAYAVTLGSGPTFYEPLAALCEALGQACLNVGTWEYWDRAETLFAEALDLREKLKKELHLHIEIAEERTLESMLQLARARTHARHVEGSQALDQAEAKYFELLSRSTLQSKPMLRAHALKELADNFRFKGDDLSCRQYFGQALEAYRSVPARLLMGDPATGSETLLNIAYCLRRLGREDEANAEFVRATDAAHRRRDRRRVAYSLLQRARSPLVQSTPSEAMYLAGTAWRIMKGEGASADATEAEKLMDAYGNLLSPEMLQEVAFRVAESEYAQYF